MTKGSLTQNKAQSAQEQKCQHHFVFLRQITQIVSRYDTRYYDVFYCDACLIEQRIEVDPTMRDYDHTARY